MGHSCATSQQASWSLMVGDDHTVGVCEFHVPAGVLGSLKERHGDTPSYLGDQHRAVQKRSRPRGQAIFHGIYRSWLLLGSQGNPIRPIRGFWAFLGLIGKTWLPFPKF